MTSSNARNADKKHCHVIRASCMSIIPPQGFKCWCISLSGSPLSASVPFEVPEKDAERSSSDLLLLGVNRSSVPQTFSQAYSFPHSRNERGTSFLQKLRGSHREKGEDFGDFGVLELEMCFGDAFSP